MAGKKYTVMIDGKPIEVSMPIKKVKTNKALKNKKSGLGKKIATTALILSIGTGTIFGAHALWENFRSNATDPVAIVQTTETNNKDQLKQGLRFDPNSQTSIIDNAVFLIEDAAKAGKELDAEDAVLAVIAANSDELKPGFVGKLFGEKKDQEYTYAQLVDSYLRVGMMNVENMAISKNDDLAFNTENIFASQEDYDYLNNIRNLSMRFNNSTDKEEKIQIAAEFNKIAEDLRTYETYDISSAAGALSMLSLDGMRIISNTNSNYTILPNDIRDEIFGDGDYSCHSESTFVSNDGQVLQTQYSYRVNDLKLDSVKAKLDNAVLQEGEKTILDDIIRDVKDRTKDVVISDVDAVEVINDAMEANRDIPYVYESKPGEVKSNYTPKTNADKVEKVAGKDVIVSQDKTDTLSKDKTVTSSKDKTDTSSKDKTDTSSKDKTDTSSQDKIDTSSKDKTYEEAQKEVKEEAAKKQEQANIGAADGKYDGERGLKKRSLNNKSQTYINAYNVSYDAYKAIYDAERSAEEIIPVSDPKPTAYESQNTYVEPTTVKPETYESQNTYVEPTPQVSNENHNNDYGEVVEESFISVDDLTPEQLKELLKETEGEEPIYIEEGKTR